MGTSKESSLSKHPNYKLPHPEKGETRVMFALRCAAMLISPPQVEGESEEIECVDAAKQIQSPLHCALIERAWTSAHRDGYLTAHDDDLRSTIASLQSRLEESEAVIGQLNIFLNSERSTTELYKSRLFTFEAEHDILLAKLTAAESRAQQAEEMRDRAVDQLEKLTFHIQWYLELTTTRPDGTPVKPLVPANRSSVEIEAAKLTLKKLLTSPPSGRTDGERLDQQTSKYKGGPNA